MSGYTKLFSSILMSSIWEESNETRLVWVTLLALADQHGHVDGTARSLARVSRVSIKACNAALTCLLGPDKDDRSGVLDGRRIVAESGGWRLVNHAAYRARMTADERRERDKLRKREARLSAARPQQSEIVRDVSQAEAEAEAEQKQEERTTRAPVGGLITPPKNWGLNHGPHVGGFCNWMCMMADDFHRFSERLGGDDKARAWAESVRASGVVPTGKPWTFWNTQFDSAHGSAAPTTGGFSKADWDAHAPGGAIDKKLGLA